MKTTFQKRISTYDFPMFSDADLELYHEMHQQQQSAPEAIPNATNSTNTITSTTTTINPSPQQSSKATSAADAINHPRNNYSNPRKSSVSHSTKPLESSFRQKHPKPQTDEKTLFHRQKKYKPVDDDEIIDLRSDTKQRPVVPVSEMYNADIDYMNKYLKSLPDYNELNNKINREFQKCEAMYDQLQSINSGLKNNPLAKSSSYQSIYNQRYGVPGISSNRNATNPTAAATTSNTTNKISRSTSSSIIPQRGTADLGFSSATIVRQFPVDGSVGRQSNAQQPPPHYQSQQFPPSNHQPPGGSQAIKLQKSSSSNSCAPPAAETVARTMNSKQFLNDFWSDNIAKSNNQKFGWNYSKIMAASKEDIRAKFDPPPPPAQNYRIQKNLSLSQLDRQIRQDLSKDDLYKLICNEPKKDAKLLAADSKVAAPSAAIGISNPPNHSKIANFLRPLTKSISQSSVPCSSQTPIVTAAASISAKTISKSSSKSNIPNFFRPLYKSTSNTHVFALAAAAVTKHEPETFVQRTGLAKSSSSSSIPLATNHPSAAPFFLRKAESSSMATTTSVASVAPNGWTNSSVAQRQISKNNDLLKSSSSRPTVRQSGCVVPGAALPAAGPSRADHFFIKQQQPNKVIVDYSNALSKVSTIRIPVVSSNTRPPDQQRTPNPLTTFKDGRIEDNSATSSPRMIRSRRDDFVIQIEDPPAQKLSQVQSAAPRQPRPLPPPPISSRAAGFTECVIRTDPNRNQQQQQQQSVRSLPGGSSLATTNRMMNCSQRLTAAVQKVTQEQSKLPEQPKSGPSKPLQQSVRRPITNQQRSHNLVKTEVMMLGACGGSSGGGDGGGGGRDINWLEEHRLIEESSSVCLIFVYLYCSLYCLCCLLNAFVILLINAPKTLQTLALSELENVSLLNA